VKKLVDIESQQMIPLPASGPRGLGASGPHLVEEEAQLAFRFADPLAETVGSFPHEEGNLAVSLAALVGERPRHQRLPGSRGAVEQTASEIKERKRRMETPPCSF